MNLAFLNFVLFLSASALLAWIPYASPGHTAAMSAASGISILAASSVALRSKKPAVLSDIMLLWGKLLLCAALCFRSMMSGQPIPGLASLLAMTVTISKAFSNIRHNRPTEIHRKVSSISIAAALICEGVLIHAGLGVASPYITAAGIVAYSLIETTTNKQS